MNENVVLYVEYASTAAPSHRSGAAGVESNSNGRLWTDKDDNGYGDGWSVTVGGSPEDAKVTGLVRYHHASDMTRKFQISRLRVSVNEIT